ncbi:MAG: hypothetical protein NNA23_10155 [Nitrospira sp.]|nr:hypothetical protein [Nitrospira sp.]MCP9463882.1 hypothetical protein [Nitrospira sp.]
MKHPLRYGLILLLLLLLSARSFAFPWADEPITIRQILEEPHAYHLRHVTLRGTVHDVIPLDPYKRPDEVVCYGAYLFRLEDETASMAVAVLGLCGTPVVRDPDVEEGDQVEVGATIQAPGHHGYHLSFSGLKVVTDQEGLVQAIADAIRPIIE